MIRPFPLIEISGTPTDRGLSYGIQAAERVHRSEQIYVRAMERRGFRWSEVKRLAKEFIPEIEAFDAGYLEELRGIAQGARVDLESVVVVNARTEIFHGRVPSSSLVDDGFPPDGCTGAVALSAATKRGSVIQGQNWDFMPECVESSVVLRILNDDGSPSILTFVEAGGLARYGLNSAGIGLTANGLKSDRDLGHKGVPLSLIRRRILESETYGQAISAVTSVRRAVSNNMTISTSVGDDAINLECTPDEVFPLYPNSDGLLTHANHFQSTVAQTKLVDLFVQGATLCTTLYRHRRVMKRLTSCAGDIEVADFKDAFEDKFDEPLGVCRRPVEGVSETEAGTVATIIFDSQAGEMHVRPAPYDPDTAYTVYRLQEVANIQDSNL